MQHNFFYKKIGSLEYNILFDLQNTITKIEYVPEPDFPDDVLTVSKNTSKIEYFNYRKLEIQVIRYLLQFFNISGHISTNVAKQAPMSYLHEHSDYGTIYTNRQKIDDTIKLQIPIITNPGVGMMWAQSATDWECVHFEESGIYIIDNVRRHSIVNLGSTDRYYLTSKWKLDSIIDKSLLT